MFLKNDSSTDDQAYLYLDRTSIRTANFFEKKGSSSVSRSTESASAPKNKSCHVLNLYLLPINCHSKMHPSSTGYAT